MAQEARLGDYRRLRIRMTHSNTPIIEIVAGPNGSGKTTFANAYLLKKGKTSVYLNPDLIASGISPVDFEKASIHAGRVLINEVKTLIEHRQNLAFESTLSGKTWLIILKRAIEQGYQIRISFIYLDSVQTNIQRIKNRVSLGGHSIPTEAVHRRHPRCFHNFWHLYRPLCADWQVLDNSGKKPKLIQNKIDFDQLPSELQGPFISSFLEGNPIPRKYLLKSLLETEAFSNELKRQVCVYRHEMKIRKSFGKMPSRA